MGASVITELESVAVSILVERAVTAKVEEINMADKLPNVRAIGPAFEKAFAKINDMAGKTIGDIEAMGDRGTTAIGKAAQPIKEANDAFAELEKALEANSNGGPL
jgi:hypothetical protein